MRTGICLAAGMLGGWLASSAWGLKVGDAPPAVEAVDQDGRSVALAEMYGHRPVVLFFYPRSFTPGCTREVQAFRDHHAQLAAYDTAVFGVSQDDVATQRRFCDEHELNYPLLSDAGGRLAAAFGVPVRGSHSSRWTIVIGRAGRVILIDPEVNADIAGHPVRVLAALEKDWKEYVAAMKPLFNGRDLSGLKTVAASDDTWTVRDGLLVCTGRPTGYIRTLEPVRDYRLLVEFQYPEKLGNAGVLVHINGEDKVWPQSIEPNLNIDQMGRFYFIEGAEGEVIGDNPARRVEVRPKSWNRLEVLCQGDSIGVWLNGWKVNEARRVRPAEGTVGLQSEGVPLQFRVWAIAPLPAEDQPATRPAKTP